MVLLLTFSCAPKYELVINSGTGGSVELTPSGGMYSAGSKVILNASADSGYSFTGWGNISGYSADSAIESVIEIVMPE